MDKKFIFGASAKKQGGKSTFLEMLGSTFGTDKVEVIRMADCLKETVIACFIPYDWGMVIEDLDKDEVKNVMLPCGKTIRQVLQMVGTDMFRGIWDNCWVNAWKGRVLDSDADVILVPDVRFPNELKAVQGMGGFVIRLTRAPFANEDQHSSETALDQVEYDSLHIMDDSPVGHRMLKFNYVLDNSNMTLEDTRAWMLKDFVPYLVWWRENRC